VHVPMIPGKLEALTIAAEGIRPPDRHAAAHRVEVGLDQRVEHRQRRRTDIPAGGQHLMPQHSRMSSMRSLAVNSPGPATQPQSARAGGGGDPLTPLTVPSRQHTSVSGAAGSIDFRGLGQSRIVESMDTRPPCRAVLRSRGVPAGGGYAFVTGPIVLFIVAFGGRAIPAVRATRVDPMNALKAE
jgi:hypothetical protein